MLGLRKEHDLAAGTDRVHGGADEGIAADGEDYGVGAAAFGFGKDALDHVFRAGMDWIA